MFAYMVTNIANGKRYIGITSKTVEKRWLSHLNRAANGSEHSLHRAIRKYGQKSFIVETIAVASSFDELKVIEVSLIAEYGTFGKMGYNMTIGGDGATGYKHSAEECERRRGRTTGRKHSEETKQKLREAHVRTGSRHTPESRAKISAANKGRKMPEDHVTKLKNRVISDDERKRRSDAAKGNTWSLGVKRTPGQCAAIGDRSRGRTLSEETKQKIREKRALQAPTYGMLGKKMSPETREKMSAAATGKKKSPETIEKMRAAARRRMAEGKNGAVNRKAD